MYLRLPVSFHCDCTSWPTILLRLMKFSISLNESFIWIASLEAALQELVVLQPLPPPPLQMYLAAFFYYRALQFGGPGGPAHVKLVVEWDLTTKEWWVCVANPFVNDYPQKAEMWLPERFTLQLKLLMILSDFRYMHAKRERDCVWWGEGKMGNFIPFTWKMPGWEKLLCKMYTQYLTKPILLQFPFPHPTPSIFVIC